MNGSWEATRQFASGTRTLTTLDMSRIDLFKKEDYGFLPAFLSHHHPIISTWSTHQRQPVTTVVVANGPANKATKTPGE